MRHPKTSLLERQRVFLQASLEAIPEYDLASAVSLLQKLVSAGLLAGGEATSASKASQGGVFSRAFGAIRFRSTVRYAHPAAALDRVELRQEREGGAFQSVLWVNFIGLAGVQGPLPLAYTERVFRNLRAGDEALAAFLDLFNHRFIQLSFTLQAWLPGYAILRPGEAPFGRFVQGLNGLEPPSEKETLPGATETSQALVRSILTYKTLFWKKVRSAETLKQVLQNTFGAQVEILQMRGTFLNLNTPTLLGPTQAQNATLGHDTLLGGRLWKQGHGVNIILRGVPQALYVSFNKYEDGASARHLRRLCRHYLPITLSVRYFIGPREGERGAPLVLGGKSNLGFDTWLGRPSKDTLVELY